jgi:sulfite reductase (ferredoxin)
MSEVTTASVLADARSKRSAVEDIKLDSRQLRGGIGEELSRDSDHFSEQDKQLIKFHGSYQQEDRDARKNRSREGLGKHYMFMVRCRIPGGRLTAKQYLAVDALAGDYANGTLRFTSRQGIQLHGVLKKDLKETIAGINSCLLTTLGACGDVERNVMACPAPHHETGVHAQLQETAVLLAAHLAPRTRAYHEIWLNGKSVSDQPAESEVEPLYGKVYLPRKFKTGLALPEDNCIDIYAQDLGLLAIVENGTIRGYNVLVGGGMGMTHGNQNTFPHLGKPICYVPAAAVVGAAEAVVRLFRDHGNRADRKRARIKYLVHDWGVDKFREVLAGYIGGKLIEPVDVRIRGFEPHVGWHPQGNGKWFYGICVENGRVKDEGSMRLRTALRRLIERLQPALRLTPLQDILLCDLDGSAKEEIDRTLDEFGVRRPDQVSAVQKFSLACPAIPTCGLAISESERALPAIIDQLEAELERLGLGDEKLSVRMTGCPNGCVRPYQSDVGIVGRSGDKYSLFVGGHVLGDRLNFMLKDLVRREEIVPTLVLLLEKFKGDRLQAETFGDYCHRLGLERLQAILDEAQVRPIANDMAASARAGLDKKDGRKLITTSESVNGNGHSSHPAIAAESVSSLREPGVQSIPLTMSPPSVAAGDAQPAAKSKEDFFAGERGEELRDYTFVYDNSGSVVETIVYFYGADCRAAGANRAMPLTRKAVYRGKVNPLRLHTARKVEDIFYVGGRGQERRDRQISYHPSGEAARTFVFYYEGEERASAAASSAPLRRVVAYAGQRD